MPLPPGDIRTTPNARANEKLSHTHQNRLWKLLDSIIEKEFERRQKTKKNNQDKDKLQEKTDKK